MAVFVTKVVYEICSVISFTKTPFNQDCLISLFLEMQRIYIHPMIGGCPDSMLTQSTSWEDAFIQSSGKMLCLDYCLSCAKKVAFMTNSYSRIPLLSYSLFILDLFVFVIS